jgi:hypothetical protein
MNKLIKEIITLCPSFEEEWEKYLKSWFQDEEDGDPTSLDVFTSFSRHVCDQLINNKNESWEKIFEWAEKLQDSEYDNDICVNFLENIMNRIPKKISVEVAKKNFFPYLGPKSKDFCQEWDKFTGFKTDGLY